jgi:hypothetical protein
MVARRLKTLLAAMAGYLVWDAFLSNGSAPQQPDEAGAKSVPATDVRRILSRASAHEDAGDSRSVRSIEVTLLRTATISSEVPGAECHRFS